MKRKGGGAGRRNVWRCGLRVREGVEELEM